MGKKGGSGGQRGRRTQRKSGRVGFVSGRGRKGSEELREEAFGGLVLGLARKTGGFEPSEVVAREPEGEREGRRGIGLEGPARVGAFSAVCVHVKTSVVWE
jgi:hypothetical protein